MNARAQLHVALALGVAVGFGVAVIIARHRIKKLPVWKKVLLWLIR